MPCKLAAVTLALSLPAFLWPPKPARAATAEIAPAVSASPVVAQVLAQ